MLAHTFQKRQRQQGIVLALVLMMLGIMSLVGALTMRNSAVTEQVTNNLRTANVAHQAAELALKYCEQVATDKGNTGFDDDRKKIAANTITAAISTGIWNQTSTWKASSPSNVIKVPSSFSKSSDSSASSFNNAPQCVIDPLDNGAGKGFVITGRGFGNDAQINASTNVVTSGSEAWVQSILIK